MGFPWLQKNSAWGCCLGNSLPLPSTSFPRKILKSPWKPQINYKVEVFPVFFLWSWAWIGSALYRLTGAPENNGRACHKCRSPGGLNDGERRDPVNPPRGVCWSHRRSSFCRGEIFCLQKAPETEEKWVSEKETQSFPFGSPFRHLLCAFFTKLTCGRKKIKKKLRVGKYQQNKQKKMCRWIESFTQRFRNLGRVGAQVT